MSENKILVFDMDGTIADLYGVDNWLEALRAENPSPYRNARPMYNMERLRLLLEHLRKCGWRIVVTSWLSMGSSKEYDRLTREAKLEWLDKYHFPYDEIHLVKYGTTKANCTRRYGGYQVLVDDNQKVRRGWNLGSTIDATQDITEALEDLMKI